jgi:hypothetical protein
MNSLLFLLALVLTIVSSLVHIATYILKEYNNVFFGVFIIHILIFVPLSLMVFQKRNGVKNISVRGFINPFELFKAIIPSGNNIVYGIIVICFAYTFISFFLNFKYLTNGIAEIIDGKYVLNNKGEITEVTREIYNKQKLYEIRLFSGHWIIFSIVPMFYFYFNRNKKIKK